MCSVRHSPMPSAPNCRAVFASSGVSAFGLTGRRRKGSAHLPEKHATRRTINRDPLAFSNSGALDGELLLTVVDIQSVRATDARLAHAARDYRGVTRHTTARRNDRLRRDHAVKVVGTRLESHEYYFRAVTRHLPCFIRTENNLALRSARTCRQTGGEHSRIRLRIDSRMQ